MLYCEHLCVSNSRRDSPNVPRRTFGSPPRRRVSTYSRIVCLPPAVWRPYFVLRPKPNSTFAAGMDDHTVIIIIIIPLAAIEKTHNNRSRTRRRPRGRVRPPTVRICLTGTDSWTDRFSNTSAFFLRRFVG